MIFTFLHTLLELLGILVVVKVLLSYVLDPFHPVRTSIDRIVEPLLAPIRQIIPPISMIDFSPIILIFLIQAVDRILVAIY